MTEVVPDAGTSGDGDGAPADIAARSPLELFWRRLRRDKVALVAIAIITIVVLVAIFAKQVTEIAGTPGPKVPADPSSLLDDFGQPLGPSSGHPFGIGRNGVDVFAQVVYGARTSLLTAAIATFLTMIIGVSVGLVAGYYRGWVDSLLSRTMDLVLAFPVLVLAVGIGVACSGKDGCLGGLLQPGLTVVIFVITLTSWPYMARIIRGQVLSLREREFVDAARSIGASDARIIFREILPNLVAPIIVYATVLIPQNILYEAALSFLGIGANTDTASWGAMLSNATSIFRDAWWYMTYPGAALLITVLAFNLVGDGLQDALNSKTAK